MSKVIIIANQKGGVAKTTTTLNLGIGLARLDKKVLLIDNDPQGSLTAALGFQRQDSLEYTISDVYKKLIDEEALDVQEGILHHCEGVDLMPANLDLAGVENSLVNVMSCENILKEYVSKVDENYDYIIVDCSPNLGLLTVNALACADSVIIPVLAQYLSVKGLEMLLKTINKVKRKINNKLKIEGILLTMVDYRTNYEKDLVDVVYQLYGDNIHIFKDSIPLSVRAAEISAKGISIYKHDKNGKVASAYEALTREVVNLE